MKLSFSDLSDQLNIQHQGLSDSSTKSGGSVVSLEETLGESSDEPAVSDETTGPTRRAAGRFKKLLIGLIYSRAV